MTSAKSVFVCYAHADSRKWLNLVREHLAPVVRHDQIAVWSDQNLRAGDRWDEEIAQQLASARAWPFCSSAGRSSRPTTS